MRGDPRQDIGDLAAIAVPHGHAPGVFPNSVVLVDWLRPSSHPSPREERGEKDAQAARPAPTTHGNCRLPAPARQVRWNRRTSVIAQTNNVLTGRANNGVHSCAKRHPEPRSRDSRCCSLG